MGKRRHPEELCILAVDMVRTGSTRRAAAQHTGLSPSYVETLCARAGLPTADLVQQRYFTRVRERMRVVLSDDTPVPKPPDSPCFRCAMGGLCIENCLLGRGVDPKSVDRR